MPQPRAVPGTLGDVVGFALWELGLGMSESDVSVLLAQAFPEVNPINLASALNLSGSAVKLGDLATSEWLTPGRQPYMVPVIQGAPEGYNYQVVITVTNTDTGQEEERELRIVSPDPLAYQDICSEASQQVEFYIKDSPRWAGRETLASGPEGFTSIQCTVAAVYRG